MKRYILVYKKAKSDPDWAMSVLLSLSSKVKARTKLPKTDKNYYNPSSFGNYFKAIKKLFDMNGVPVVWKRIHVTFPEPNDHNYIKLCYKQNRLKNFLYLSLFSVLFFTLTVAKNSNPCDSLIGSDYTAICGLLSEKTEGKMIYLDKVD